METLREIADVESELTASSRNLAPYIERRNGLAERVAVAKQRTDEAVRAEGEARIALRNLESDLQDLESRLAGERRKIDFVASMRAAQAAEAELSGMEARRSTLEEEVLEAMESHDQATAALQHARAEFEALRLELDETGKEIAATTEAARVVMDALAAKRAALVETLPVDIAKKARLLLSRHVASIAVMVEAEYCPACKATIKANAISHLHAGQHAFCDQCGRILVSI